MVVGCIIQLLEGVETRGEVWTKARRVVVSDRTPIWMILMLVVVRKTADFLVSQLVSPRLIFVLDTFGRRMLVFNPLNLFVGWMLKNGILNDSRFHDLLFGIPCFGVVTTTSLNTLSVWAYHLDWVVLVLNRACRFWYFKIMTSIRGVLFTRDEW